MKKKDDDIASALTLIALANRHIREYPSTAEDAETDPENRLTKHFAEYLANRMSRELDAVQAAAILLNHPLASSSHKEVFMRVSSHQVCRAAARSVNATSDRASIGPPLLPGARGATSSTTLQLVSCKISAKKRA